MSARARAVRRVSSPSSSGGQTERRHEEQRIAQRAEEKSMLAGAQANREAGPPARIGNGVVSGGRAAAVPDFPDGRVAGERLLQQLAEAGDARGQFAAGDQRAQFADILQRHCRGQRIAGERVPVEERPAAGVRTEEGGVDLLARERGRERQVARGQPLREAEKIRRHSLLRANEHRAEPAEGDEDLVKDQMDPVLAAEGRHCQGKPRRLQPHPGRPLDGRLENQAGRAVRLGLEEDAEGPQARFGVGQADPAIPFAAFGGGEMGRGEAPGPETLMEKPAVAYRHRPEGVAMVAASQPDDPALFRSAGELPILEGKLECDLDGPGAVVAEEHATEAGRGQPGELGRQFRADGVRKPQHGRMRHLVQLPPQGGVEVRVVVPVDVRPDRGIAIEIGAALRVGQPAAPPGSDRQGGQAGILLHLRKRMPHMPKVGGMNARPGGAGARRRVVVGIYRGQRPLPAGLDKPYVNGPSPLT